MGNTNNQNNKMISKEMLMQQFVYALENDIEVKNFKTYNEEEMDLRLYLIDILHKIKHPYRVMKVSYYISKLDEEYIDFKILEKYHVDSVNKEQKYTKEEIYEIIKFINGNNLLIEAVMRVEITKYNEYRNYFKQRNFNLPVNIEIVNLEDFKDDNFYNNYQFYRNFIQKT